jgi:5-methylcytosine-specific restriction endonuclease McrA
VSCSPFNIAARKPVHIVDPSAKRRVRTKRDGVCLYGLIHKDGCSGGLDAHHIIPEGVGGPDVDENLISLCRKHHNLAEARIITPEVLQQILSHLFGYQYDANGHPKTYKGKTIQEDM